MINTAYYRNYYRNKNRKEKRTTMKELYKIRKEEQ